MPISLRSAVARRSGIDLSKGLLHYLNPFYKTVAGVAAREDSLRGILRQLDCPAGFETTGENYDYPSNRDYGMSNELNGVTHDEDYWYIVQKYRIWRIPVGFDLNEEPNDSFPCVYNVPNPVPFSNASDIPFHGYYNHYGSPGWHGKYLYVPVEHHADGEPYNPRVFVYDSDLHFVDSAPLLWSDGTPQSDCAWCAINPLNGLLHCSLFYGDDPGHALQLYQPHFDGNFTLEYVGELPLYTVDGAPRMMSQIQAGAFSSRGHLYVVVDDGTGVVAFDTFTGRQFGHIRVDYTPDTGPNHEELEGITIWDLDGGQAPGIRGQIHLQMIDNDWEYYPGGDDLYFKHFRVKDPADKDRI